MKLPILILGLILSAQTFAAIPLQIEFPVRGSKSLRSQVNSYVTALNNELAQEQNRHEKFRLISRGIDDITMLRDNGMPQSAQDDAYMDLIVAVYASIPTEKDFKKRDCLRYENDLLNQFEPNADEAPSEPAVKPGWQALQVICR